MANGFRKHIALGLTTGSGGNVVFVSKAGLDSNAGTTPDAPKATLAAALALGKDYIIMGAGAYVLTGNVSVAGAANDCLIYADGFVAIDCAGYIISTGRSGGLYNLTMTNIGGFNVCQYGVPQTHFYTFNCDLTFTTAANNIYAVDNRAYPIAFNSSILRNFTLGSPGYTPNVAVDYCLLLGSTVELATRVTYCYLDASSKARVIGAANYNNWRGQIAIGSSGAYQSLAAQQAASPTINANSINSEPGFNLPLRRDYTLKASSPHLGLGIGPNHLRYAQTWYVASTCAAGEVCTPANTWLVNSADNSIINFLNLTGFSWSQQGSLYITENTAGGFEASYRTAPLQIAAVAQTLKGLPCLTGLNYNTDFPAVESGLSSNQPDVNNNNVPAIASSVSGSVGRNPARLTTSMRWSTRQAPQDNLTTDWVTGDVFLPFELFSSPAWNQSTSKGNGDPAFDPTPANVQPVRALWIQFVYVARNNYYSK